MKGLQKHITVASKMVEQSTLLNHNLNRGKNVVIVEGKSDSLLFKKLLNNDNVGIDYFGGKKETIKLIKYCYKNKIKHFERIIAICDADFDNLNNKKHHPAIFLTDSHDSETLIIEAIGIEALIAEHSYKGFEDALKRNLLQNATKLAYEIGLIKWSNSKSSQLNLNFKDKKQEPLNLSEFITFNNFDGEFEQGKYIKRVLRQSSKQSQTETNLLKKVQTLKLEQADEFQVCNGHDLTSIMALIIYHYENNKNKKVMFSKKGQKQKQDEIESNLRVSYNIENFKKTNLYKQLKNWQTVNQMPKIVD